jgi:hypothetical protein
MKFRERRVETTISNLLSPVTFEVLTAWTIKITILRAVTPCNVVDAYRCFRGICCLHSQGQWVNRARNYSARCSFPAWLLGLPFDPEDGGNMFLLKSMSSIRLNGVTSQKIAVFLVDSILAYFPYFEEIKESLWDHLAVCICSPIIVRLMRSPCCLYL